MHSPDACCDHCERREPCVPWLKYLYPTHYLVILSLLVAHIGLGIDAFQAQRHVAPVYAYVRDQMPFWGTAHFFIGSLLILGLLLPPHHWWIARAGILLSLVTFNAYACLLAVPAIEHPTVSWFASLMMVAMSLSSLAVYLHAAPPPDTA